ncbi:hypothetical protein GCM10009665_11110 [Kitasatospora nipponensis]|uniref:Uncharacterized protein n=2 Tax=Kitasatospora nipponensis TaxID=258049 RepID=A0ABN1VUF9_9ACTN
MPPDPSHWDRYQRSLQELAEQPPYTIYGLRRPVVEPGYLAGWCVEEGTHVSVGLGYGDEEGAALPDLLVTTLPPGSAEREIDLELELRADSPLPPETWVTSHEQLPQGELCRCGDRWLLRARCGTQAVLVTGRGGAQPARVELEPVVDLQPFVVARNELIERHRAARAAEPEPELAPACGIAAVRALLETALPGGSRDGRTTHRLWQRAVRELDGVLGCGPERADYLVTSLVNQLNQLNLAVPWYTGPNAPREAALEELLRHVGLRQPVASEAAQARWEEHWSTQQQAPLAPVTPAEIERRKALKQAWVAAWEAWERDRREP